MKFKALSNKLITSSSIAVIYFIICSLYIVFSDKFLLVFGGEKISNDALTKIQSYKGIFFVFFSSFLIYFLLKRRDRVLNKYTSSLKKNQKQYQDLFTNMSHGVVYATPEGIITSLNQSTLDILGVSEKQMIGKSIFDDSWKPISSDGKSIEIYENPTKRAIRDKKPVRNDIVGAVNVKTGLYVWLKLNVIPEFESGDEEPFRVCITIDDITQLKNYQQELEESKKQINESLQKTQFSEFLLKEASKMTKIGVYEIYPKIEETYFSKEFYRFFGISSHQKFSLENISQFIPEKYYKMLQKGVKDLMESGTVIDEVFELNLESDKKYWIRTIIKPIYDGDKIIGRRGVVQDITAQKKAEEKIVQSEQRFKALVQEGSDLYAIIDKTGNYIYMSPSSTAIIGIPPEVFIGKNAFEYLHPDDAESALESLKKVITQDRVVMEHYRAKNHKNEWRWVETVLTNMLNNPAVKGIVVNSRDITAQVEQEEKLIRAKEVAEENERKMKEAQKIAHLGGWYYDVINKVSYWSEETYNIWGFDTENTSIDFLDHQERIHPKDWEYFIATVDNATQKGIPYKMELELIMPDASRKIVNAIAEPIFNEKNQVIAFKGTTQDITERKTIENELRSAKEKAEKSEYTMNQASKLAKIGYWYYDAATQILTWSDYIYRLYNLTPEDNIPSYEEAKGYFDNQSQEKITKATKELNENGTSYDLELRMINSENEEIWVRNVVHAVYNNQNKIVGKRGIIQNITEAKNKQLEILKAKEKIEASELKFKLYTEKSPFVIYITNTEGECTYLNEAWIEMSGMGINESLGKKWIKALHPDDVDLVNDNWFKSVESRGKFKYEYRYIHQKDKRIVWVESTAKEMRNEKNELLGYIGTIIEITDRKKAEEERTRFQETIENSLNEIYIFDAETFQFSYANNGALLNLGYAIEEIKKLTPINIKPEYTKLSFNELIVPLKTKELEKIIFFTNHQRKDGTLYPVEVHLQLVEQQNYRRFIAIILDLTERKKAEEMYRLLANNTNDIIALQEPDFSLKYISPAVETLLGYEPKELLDKKFLGVIHEEDIVNIKEAMEEKLFEGIALKAITFRVRHKNGHLIWLESLISPVIEADKIVSIVSSNRDITASVKAKNKIQEYQASLQRLTGEISLIEEKQKKQIAANIHDHLSQSLVISKMRVADLQKNTSLNNFQKDLEFIKSHISNALENSRKITYELSPPILYQLGIIDALDWFAEETEEKYGINFQFKSNVDAIHLSEFKSILLFRCIQEAVTNIIKYAEASLITLNLINEAKTITIVLTDNGKGFDTSKLNNNNVNSQSGFGLFAVKERIRSMNGELEITSEINIGTKIKIYLSLEE